MVGTGAVLVAWAATTIGFALVYLLGKVYHADGGTKLNLALWYVASLVSHVVSWIALVQGKDELAAVLLRMTPIMCFFFVVVGRVYRTKTWENVLFIAMAAIIFGIPLGRAWESGAIGRVQPQSRALLEKLIVLFALAAVAYGIWHLKVARHSKSDLDR